MGQWVIPSDNHEGKIMMGFLIFFLIIDFFLVILRIIARVFQGVKFLSLSDWFLIAGFVRIIPIDFETDTYTFKSCSTSVWL